MRFVSFDIWNLKSGICDTICSFSRFVVGSADGALALEERFVDFAVRVIRVADAIQRLRNTLPVSCC